jgi:hypothetical protein
MHTGMLAVTDPEFAILYPNHCQVYDATGRRIPFVIACNPETGEVERYLADTNASGFQIIRVDDNGPVRSRGFFPGPLRVVPNPPCSVAA